MSLITLRDAQLAFGEHALLDGAALAVQDGERLGFIGRNGTGKSTVLKVIAGLTALDDGEVQRRSGLRIAYVEQEPLMAPSATVSESLMERARTLTHATACSAEELHGADRERWQLLSRLAEFLHRFGLDDARDSHQLSGGERKRAALALAFASSPDLLLLDEPTNHLDIEGIATLEAFTQRVPAAIIVTHDRAFLDAIATRIIELDRGVIRSYPGNFAAYESRRDDEKLAEDLARRRFEKFWAQEEVWIRKGVEARRTRNEGRVRRLERLREERLERRDRLGSIKLALDSGERSGRLVAELTDVRQSFGGRTLIQEFSTRIMRGDRVGLIGPNGAGKSTLLRIILGQLTPEHGSVRLGTHLQVAYFDQMREQLDPEATLAEAISPGSEWITIGTERKHIMTYLGDFLFAPHRAKSPVRMLSGGERNRLFLARLFARPANLLVLDEPTNDLDIDSLELLEQRLQDYSGTLLLVSHDRRFLDNVVTQTIAAEGGGEWRAYVGGYTDWLRQRPQARTPQPRAEGPVLTETAPLPTQRAARPARLGYMEGRELAALPGQIEALEHEQGEIGARLSQPDYQDGGHERIRADGERLNELVAELERCYARWEELEARRGAG
jgi:ATP-binding cassette subfamily F protein uup